MNRPYIICHMVTSLDGKVTGDFLSSAECANACKIYYDINRKLKSNGFICGRVTMEGSFTNGYYPDLSEYEPIQNDADFLPDEMTGFYAVAFDPKGKLGWKSNRIIDPDGDPGYDGAQIIEVLTKQADRRYSSYLKSLKIPYIFAGETEIDVETALLKLKNIGCETLLLEGGSVINGFFLRAEAIDELSLVTAPVIAENDDKPLFDESSFSEFKLIKAEIINGNAVFNYKKDNNSVMFRDISRKKQSLSEEKIVEILKKEKRGILSVHGENRYPYGLPINYWYNENNGYIYFHSGKKGHKTDAISSNNKVSFCVYDEGYRKDGEWALNICSVIVFGRIHIVENYEQSMEICRSLSLKHTQDINYIESEIKNFGKATVCYELRPEHITGKTVNES